MWSELTPSTPVDAAAAGLNAEALGRLRAALQQRIDAGRLPGAVVLIARRGVLGCFEALGRRDPASDAPMARDAIFRIYSMTKPIVSVAAMRFVEQGRLLLEEPIAKYLPEFSQPQVGVERDGRLELVPAARPITVHDLLRHTSGITYEFLAPSAVRKRYAEADVSSLARSNAEASALLAHLPLMHQPGTVWEYGRSTDVLGRLIEVLADRPLGDHLRETIFDPLGMPDTGFDVPAAEQHRIAEPYATDPDSGTAVRLAEIRRPMPRQSGGGGLVSTAIDYARFLQMVHQGGALGGTRLLGHKTIEYMTSDHLGTIPSVCDVLSPGHGFGLGFAVRLATGVAPMPGSVGTCSWGGIGGTQFFVDPQEDLFAVFMVQAPGQREELAPMFRHQVYAALER